MAASIPGDGVPGKLERVRSSLHALSGSALLMPFSSDQLYEKVERVAERVPRLKL